MKYYILLFFLFSFNQNFSQDFSDYLIDENGIKIFCKVQQIKNSKVKYKLRGKSYSIIKNILKFKDISFSDPDALKNPLNIKIEKPEEGYAYVYFYCSTMPYTVKYNGKKLIKIKGGTYFVHKIKAGEIHNYLAFGNGLDIEAENQKTYIVRDKEKYSINTTFIINGGFEVGGRIEGELVLDDSKMSTYALLSMKKKAE